jgi:hypothetical protein
LRGFPLVSLRRQEAEAARTETAQKIKYGTAGDTKREKNLLKYGG